MPNTLPFFHTLLLVAAALFLSQIQLQTCFGASISQLNPPKAGELDAMVKRVSAGMIGECSESESNRRVLLVQKRYISYDTLKRDLVPCEDPGVSYYDCRAPGVANHYSRGCEVITRCARGD